MRRARPRERRRSAAVTPDARADADAFPDRLRLALRFDANALLAEAHAFPADAWLPHFNTAYYEGDWSGIALRAPGGRLSLYPDPAAADAYADTPHLARAPHLRAAIAAIPSAVSSARLLRLGPGARIREHRDYQIGLEYGEVRLHVPLETNGDVAFALAGRRIEMAPGECWYVDVTHVHRVENDGTDPRIHLVIDCASDDRLRAELRTASAAAFERFAAHVAADAELQDDLLRIHDHAAFIATAIERAADRGFAFAANDVRRAMNATRKRTFDGIDGSA